MNVLKGPGWSVTFTAYKVGGGSVALPVKSWSITRSRRDPLDWSVTLPFNYDMRPQGSIGSFLQPEPYDAAHNLRRYVQAVVRVGASTYTSCKLVLKTYRVGLRNGQKILTIGGTDRTEALLEEDVVEEDVRSTEATLIGCKAVTAETFAAQGISSYDLSGFDDFNVKVFHRTGVPLSYLRELWETFQGVFYWNGDTLTVSAGGRQVGSETADYELHESENVIVLDYQKDTGGAVNEVYVERTSELKNGTNEPTVGKALGNVTITLDKPSFYGFIRVELLDPGYTGDWTWDDEEGTPLTSAPTKVFYGTTVKAGQVRFNIYPPEGSGSLELVRYIATVLVDDAPAAFGEYESDVFAVAKSDFDQYYRGRKKLPQPLTMQHVPNQTVCQQAADLKLLEKLRDYKSVQIQAPLNPLVRPDLVAAVTAFDLDLVDHNMMTETVAFQGDEKSVLMTVGLSRELTEDDVDEPFGEE